MTTRVDGGGLNPAGTYTADTFSFDAWDRLAVGSHRVTGSPTVGYDDTNVNYDALGRPMQVVVTGVNYGSSTPSDNLYYSTSGQVLEDDRVVALNGGTPTGWNRMSKECRSGSSTPRLGRTLRARLAPSSFATPQRQHASVPSHCLLNVYQKFRAFLARHDPDELPRFR